MSTYSYHVRHRNGWGSGFGPSPTHCHECGAALPAKPDTGGSGYGCGAAERVATHTDAPDVKKGETIERSPAICYACCAKHDREQMISTGRATLYLTDVKHESPVKTGSPFWTWEVTNWPGSLRFKVSHKRTGSHNITRRRYDAWFIGPDGKPWHAVQYGDNTQIAHCKRLAR